MLHSAPRLSAGAEDFRPIEADLEGFSPGRVAAVGVRGRAAPNELSPGAELLGRASGSHLTE